MAARIVFLHELKEEAEHLGRKVNDLIHLASHGFGVAESFVITHQAYLDFLKENNLEDKIRHLSTTGLEEQIEKHLAQAKLPEDLVEEILKAYRSFGTVLEDVEVDINGQKIKGDAALIEKVRQILSSSYPTDKLNIIIRRVHFGKRGKVRTSSKFINSTHPFSHTEVSLLEEMISKFKNSYYLPHEIDFTLEKGRVIINSIKPETPQGDLHDDGYKVFVNSNY